MEMNRDMQQLMKLARSPAGQQLLEALKRNGGSQVENAAALAASGNLEAARKSLSGLLESPEMQKYLRQLEDQL